VEDPEQEIKSDLDKLDQKAEQMDERTDEFEQQVGDAREDFESKQQSTDVPGAQPPEEDE
jgi:hypothetical protein